jgi:hypothetical protein
MAYENQYSTVMYFQFSLNSNIPSSTISFAHADRVSQSQIKFQLKFIPTISPKIYQNFLCQGESSKNNYSANQS